MKAEVSVESCTRRGRGRGRGRVVGVHRAIL